MKTSLALFIGACSAVLSVSAQPNTSASGGYPITPVPFTATHITGGFWKQRLDACREVTIPLALSKCEETGRYDNFVKAAHPSDDYKVGGFPFDDTDVYKTFEGVGYLLQTFPDKKLSAYVDSVVTLIAAAQEPDGYLYTARTMNPKHPHNWSGSKRWEAVENISHEFYNLGHLIEGAVAYYQATGKRQFLDIAVRYADCVCREIGDGAGKMVRVPGHQIAELALCKLYLITGEKKYLDQAKFFLDKRGYTTRKDAYSQAHKPVVQQDEAVGHAVRAAYMYAGMADVAALTNDTSYVNAIDRIWENIVAKKLYLTGGIGATSKGEAFGANYELPNATAYCETCAAIGNVYVNHRLFLFHGDAKYYDVLERSLYNGVLSGISLDGGKFFYPNPLESDGGNSRQPWFGCACCPSNLCRFLPSVPGYVYAVKDRSLYVNLYMEGKSAIHLDGKKLEWEQTTQYPFEGDIQLVLRKGNGNFDVKLRIPSWSRSGDVVPSDLYAFSDGHKASYSVRVNGQEVSGTVEKGYLTISRKWKKGDVVTLRLDMTPRTVVANKAVKADLGRMAVECGPLVYCAEEADNRQFPLFHALVPSHTRLEVTDEKAPGGAKVVTAEAQLVEYTAKGQLQTKDVTLKLIPYYAWCNRGANKMTVWFPTIAGAMHITTADRVGQNEFYHD